MQIVKLNKNNRNRLPTAIKNGYEHMTLGKYRELVAKSPHLDLLGAYIQMENYLSHSSKWGWYNVHSLLLRVVPCEFSGFPVLKKIAQKKGSLKSVRILDFAVPKIKQIDEERELSVEHYFMPEAEGAYVYSILKFDKFKDTFHYDANEFSLHKIIKALKEKRIRRLEVEAENRLRRKKNKEKDFAKISKMKLSLSVLKTLGFCDYGIEDFSFLIPDWEQKTVGEIVKDKNFPFIQKKYSSEIEMVKNKLHIEKGGEL